MRSSLSCLFALSTPEPSSPRALTVHRYTHHAADERNDQVEQAFPGEAKWRERAHREVSRSLLVVEISVVRDDEQDGSHERSILGDLSSGGGMRVWHARTHLNALEGLLHVPFVLRLLDFFVKPRETGRISELRPIDSDPLPTIVGQCHWRMELVVSRVDFTLINHTQGPNMPLMRISLCDVFVLGVHRTEHTLQCDVRLPLECSAFNQETNAFESLIEPLLVGARVKLTVRRESYSGGEIFTRVQAGYNHQSVHVAATPINVTLTQLTLAAFLNFVPSVLQMLEESKPDKDDDNEGTAKKGAKGGASAAPNARAVAAQPHVTRNPSTSSSATTKNERPPSLQAANRERIEAIRTPYWVHNALGVDVRVALDGSTQGPLPVADGARVALRLDGLGNNEVFVPSSKRNGAFGGTQGGGAGSGILTTHAVSIESGRFNGRVRAVQIDMIGRTVARVPFPLNDNPLHEASLVCSVSVLNDKAGSSNLLQLDTLLRVRNDTRHTILITMYGREANERGGAATSAQARNGLPDVDDFVHEDDAHLVSPGPDAEDIMIEPGQTHSLPLALAHLRYIAVRPSLAYYKSEPRRISELATSTQRCHVSCNEFDGDPATHEADLRSRRERLKGLQAISQGNGCTALASALPPAVLLATQRAAAHAHAVVRKSCPPIAVKAPESSASLNSSVPSASPKRKGSSTRDALASLHYILTHESHEPNTRRDRTGNAARDGEPGQEEELYEVGGRRAGNARWREDAQHTVVVSPPIIVENLLTCPMKFTIVDRSAMQDARLNDGGTSAPTYASSATRNPITQQLLGEIPRGGSLHFHQFPATSTLELTAHLPGFSAEDFVLIRPVGKLTSLAQVRSNLLSPFRSCLNACSELRANVDPYAAATKEQRNVKYSEAQPAQRGAAHGKLQLYEILKDEDEAETPRAAATDAGGNEGGFGSATDRTMDSDQRKGRQLVLDVETKERSSGARKLTVYTKFWLINKTGLNLGYRMAPTGLLALPELWYTASSRVAENDGSANRRAAGRHLVAGAATSYFATQPAYPRVARRPSEGHTPSREGASPWPVPLEAPFPQDENEADSPTRSSLRGVDDYVRCAPQRRARLRPLVATAALLPTLAVE
jgi:hypothetical protein